MIKMTDIQAECVHDLFALSEKYKDRDKLQLMVARDDIYIFHLDTLLNEIDVMLEYIKASNNA